MWKCTKRDGSLDIVCTSGGRGGDGEVDVLGSFFVGAWGWGNIDHDGSKLGDVQLRWRRQ